MGLECNIKQHLYCVFFFAELMPLLDCDVQHSLALAYYVPNKANMGKDEAWPTLEVEGSLALLCSGFLHGWWQVLLRGCCHRAPELRQPSSAENMSPYSWCSAASHFLSE